MTARELIIRSCYLLGHIRPGMGLGADVETMALSALNDLLSNWRIQSLLVFVISDATFTLVIGQQSYTIGPSGANLTAARPTFIKDANLILTSTTPNIRRPIGILRDSSEWAAVMVRTITSSIPLLLYYEPTIPNGTINLWPIPGAAYQLELFTWAQLTAFADLTTDVALAPGYENALKYNLALELAPTLPNKLLLTQFGKDRLDLVAAKAGRYVADLKSHNATPRRLASDAPPMAGMSRRSNWNYLTGNLGGSR